MAFWKRSADPEVVFVRNVGVTMDAALNTGSKTTRVGFFKEIGFIDTGRRWRA